MVELPPDAGVLPPDAGEQADAGELPRDAVEQADEVAPVPIRIAPVLN